MVRLRRYVNPDIFKIEVFLDSTYPDLKELRTRIHESLEHIDERVRVICVENQPKNYLKDMPVFDAYSLRMNDTHVYIGMLKIQCGGKVRKLSTEDNLFALAMCEFKKATKLKLYRIAALLVKRSSSDKQKNFTQIVERVRKVLGKLPFPFNLLSPVLEEVEKIVNKKQGMDKPSISGDLRELLKEQADEAYQAVEVPSGFREKLRKMQLIEVEIATPWQIFNGNVNYRTELKKNIAKDCKRWGVDPQSVWLQPLEGNGNYTLVLVLLPSRAISPYLKMRGQWSGNVVDAWLIEQGAIVEQLEQREDELCLYIPLMIVRGISYKKSVLNLSDVERVVSERNLVFEGKVKRSLMQVSSELASEFALKIFAFSSTSYLPLPIWILEAFIKSVFVCYDYEYDQHLRKKLAKQLRYIKSAFTVVQYSNKIYERETWESKTRTKIAKVDVIVVLVGDHTYKTMNVKKEITIAKDMSKKVIYLDGRKHESSPVIEGCAELLPWTWENVKDLFGRIR